MEGGLGFISAFTGATVRHVGHARKVERPGAVSMVAAATGRQNKFEAMRKKYGVRKTEGENAGFSYVSIIIRRVEGIEEGRKGGEGRVRRGERDKIG